MFPRRFGMAAVSAMILLSATAGVAIGAKPTPVPAPVAPTSGGERPLTPDEEARAAAKLAAAEAYVALAGRDGRDLVSLACVTPTSINGGASINACAIPQGFLTVEAGPQ